MKNSFEFKAATLLIPVAAVLFLSVLSQCSNSKPQVIEKRDWGFRIEILTDWEYEIKDSSISVSRINKSLVKGQMTIDYIADTMTTGFDEYFSLVTYDLGSFFPDYQKVSEGRSQVNNLTTIWHRMRSSHEGNLTEVLLYFIELDTNKYLNIICVARVDTFPEYEPEFTKMVYSLEKI